MWPVVRHRLIAAAAAIALLWALPAAAAAQGEFPDDQTSGIEHHERMLAQRTAEVERVRDVLQRAIDEMTGIEGRYRSEPDPTLRKYLEVRLENARLLVLRRTILLRRSELKQQELAEELERLKQDAVRVAPRQPQQKLAVRRAGLTRRLNVAEGLLALITQYQEKSVTEREQRRISQLAQREREVIADIRSALAMLEDGQPAPSQQ